MSQVDELRMSLPRIIAELGSAVDQALLAIHHAVRISEHTAGDTGMAWKKGLTDALVLLRPAQEANERLKGWCERAAEEAGVDHEALMNILADLKGSVS